MSDPLRNAINWNEECLHWRGAVLTGKYAHYCLDWDCLPVDETCSEFTSCGCYTNEEKDGTSEARDG